MLPKKFLLLFILIATYVYSQQQIVGIVVEQKNLKNLYTSTSTINERISKFIIDEVYNKNFNTIIFKFDKENFFLPQSSTSKQINYLDTFIEETKKYGIKLFVMINTLSTSSSEEPTLLCKTDNKDYYVPYYYSVGNPTVQQYLIDFLKNFLNTYKVDGIIFDEIWYPSETTSYDDISLYRFYTRGNPKLLDFFDYQREQLNLLISKLYCYVKSINKDTLVAVTTGLEYKNTQNLSGCYYKNFQDVKLWVEKNWVDFVVVKTTFVKENINLSIDKEKIVVLLPKDFIFKDKIQENYLGFIYSSIIKDNFITYNSTFPTLKTDYNILLGYVFDETLTPLNDAWVSLYSQDKLLDFTLSSKEGMFCFVNKISNSTFTIKIEYPWCEPVTTSVYISTEDKIFEISSVVIQNASLEKNKLFFYIYQPKDLNNVQKSVIHILGRTYPKHNVSIFSEDFSTNVKVYPTGMFAIDNLKLTQKENIFVFTIFDEKKINFTQQQIKIIYSTSVITEQQKILEKNFVLLSPKEDLLLFTNDVLELKIKSEKNKKFYAICFDNNQKIFLDEIEDGVYYKRFLIPENFSSKKTNLVFFYEEKIPKKFFLQRQKIKTVSYPTDYYVEVWNSAYPLIAETVSEKTPMTYGLHYVRLGGPYITELPKGIKLQVVGKKQDKYKVKLSSTFSGWVDQKDVVLKLNETKILQNYFTSITITNDTEKDKIIIPWVERTPFSVSSSIEEDKLFLVIDFFNTHFATTWVINHLNTKVLDYPKISQIEDGHLRIVFPIKQKYLWGFWAEVTKSNLVIYVNHPPKINKENVLKAIKIGIEAGHGGDDNIGALGVSGTKEKNINLTAAQVLKSVLEKEGAKVVFLREGDTNPDFSKRLATAYNSDVDLIISLHANSTDTERNGYLKNSGFSVYYKWDHCRILAEEIFKELKNLWDTTDGLIGNFNYAPIRQTRIPAVLIEQGYMTNPYDESKLLDKNFLYQESLLIKNALKKFFKKIIE